MDIYELENSSGVVVSVGGQLPRKPYFHTNLLFSSMEAQSLGAALGAGLVPLSLCLGSVAPQLPSSRSHFRNYSY
jgi:hypothetical protein